MPKRQNAGQRAEDEVSRLMTANNQTREEVLASRPDLATTLRRSGAQRRAQGDGSVARRGTHQLPRW